jgi:hypothetical protein
MVAACMRLRGLGMGQSVMFCIPEEIQSKIHAITGKPRGLGVDVSDVLLWTMSETSVDIRRSMPLWALQGARFERQRAIWADVTSSEGIRMSSQQAERFLEDEAQSLECRYKPSPSDGSTEGQLPFSEENANLSAIRKRCEAFGSLHFKSSALREEQERELSPEIEREREVERPPAAEPELHHLHPHVVSFVATGRPPLKSPAFITAFQTLQNTSAADHLGVDKLPRGILATVDYMRTVKLGTSRCADSYQRPIQWILTSTDGGPSGSAPRDHQPVRGSRADASHPKVRTRHSALIRTTTGSFLPCNRCIKPLHRPGLENELATALSFEAATQSLRWPAVL